MTQRPEDLSPRDDDPEDDDLFGKRPSEREGRHKLRPAVTDFVRRAFENTMGSVQVPSSAPREALDFLLKQGDRSRREIFRVVANEVSDFLKQVDLGGEIVKVLTSVQVELNASVRFKPVDGTTRVEVDPSSDFSVSVAGPGGARKSEAPPRDEEG